LPIREWPLWWEWELELSHHLLKRMIDRQFTEVDLRRMMEYPGRLRADVVEGRWIIEAWHDGRPWHVIVEPDFDERVVVVVTAYPLR
jgi:hypothetical protein